MENNGIIPSEVLNDVFPGDQWQPEPAARYNAVNALLRQGYSPQRTEYCGLQDQGGVVNLLNVSDTLLPVYGPVELILSGRADNIIDFRNPMIYGGPVKNIDCRWGVALENIEPGHAGPVQISGITFLHGVEKAADHFVTVIPLPNGGAQYEFAGQGRAEVLYADDYKRAVISLGTSAARYSYDGMFAVKDNGSGSFTIKGGITDIDDSSKPGQHFIDDMTITPPDSDKLVYILLVASFEAGSWKLSYKTTEDENYYIPGRQIFWHLAYYRGFDHSTGFARDLTQLWQGGMICFRDRFYIS